MSALILWLGLGTALVMVAASLAYLAGFTRR